MEKMNATIYDIEMEYAKYQANFDEKEQKDLAELVQ
jgi:hypothetical protein